jgi:nicotinamide mononucleotide (NMN) deamidase PncC
VFTIKVRFFPSIKISLVSLAARSLTTAFFHSFSTSAGTPEKPVGLVYVGAAVNGLAAVKELRLRGSRRMIRERAVAAALYLLYELLDAPENNLC